VPVDLTAASQTLKVAFHRTLPQRIRQLYLLKGLYITTSESEVIFGDDSILNLQHPTQLDLSPPRKGNILANSSFEVGAGHGWGTREGSARPYTVASLWDNTAGFDGVASLKVPNLEELVSRVYEFVATGNTRFPNTFSAWVKTVGHKGAAKPPAHGFLRNVGSGRLSAWSLPTPTITTALTPKLHN
jgi:hypothetical protein